jgi:hypothetical protein
MTAMVRGTWTVVVALVVLASGWVGAQTNSAPEEFTATAIANDELGAGAGQVIMRITRWSTEAEGAKLVETVRSKGQRALLDVLSGLRSVGTIRTPDSLAYDLRYASQRKTDEGARQIVLATDRPIGFWEAANRPRTIEYPFTVIQMQIGRDGQGKGTLSYATKIRAYGNVIELENFTTAPIMLTNIESKPIG